LQSVLLDRRSLIVAYDVSRGEPRGKIKKALPVVPTFGDCVDCGACVRTCPTGIDIRNGLQMECIHCTQCIDACDEIMDRVGRPRGLIRYSCQTAIDGGKTSFLRARVLLYPLALAVVAGAFLLLFFDRDSFDATLLRNLGSPFTVTSEGRVQNLFRIKIVNRADTAVEYSFSTGSNAELAAGSERLTLQPGETVTKPLMITAPRSVFRSGIHESELHISNSLGEEEVMSCRLLGP
jgi:cytochrome c oxidase accessory protein FixG